MTTTTIYSESGDGYLAKEFSGDYNDARDSASADHIYTNINYILCGWGTAALFRGFLYFDTSGLPANAEIQSATVQLYVPSGCPENEAGGQDVYLYSGQPTHPTDPLATSDFDRILYASGGANKINIEGADDEWKTFTLNSTGIGWINIGGTTKLCLRGEFDVTPTIPTSKMEVWFYASDYGSNKPKLTVNYETKPIIVTGAASSPGPTYVTGNGTMSDHGSGSITEYGFIYNDDGTDPVDLDSADNKQTSSDLSGGTFSATMSGLENATSYYYRAYMTTDVGTGYGDAVEFTTSSAPDILAVSTSDPTSVELTTARLNGNIDSDGGKIVTQHGFIFQANSDPGEPTSPTGAAHYTEEGTGSEGSYYSDVTGLTGNSVYLCRAYAQDASGGIDYGGLYTVRTYYDSVTGSAFTGATGDGDLYIDSGCIPEDPGYFYDCGPANDIDITAVSYTHLTLPTN